MTLPEKALIALEQQVPLEKINFIKKNVGFTGLLKLSQNLSSEKILNDPYEILCLQKEAKNELAIGKIKSALTLGNSILTLSTCVQAILASKEENFYCTLTLQQIEIRIELLQILGWDSIMKTFFTGRYWNCFDVLLNSVEELDDKQRSEKLRSIKNYLKKTKYQPSDSLNLIS